MSATLTPQEKLKSLQELEKTRKGKKSQALIAQLKAIYQKDRTRGKSANNLIIDEE